MLATVTPGERSGAVVVVADQYNIVTAGSSPHHTHLTRPLHRSVLAHAKMDAAGKEAVLVHPRPLVASARNIFLQ